MFVMAVLWQLVREPIGQEEAIPVGERLCLQNPNRQKLRHLALCHITYHSCRNDPVIKSRMNDFCRHNDCSSTCSSNGDSSSSRSSSSCSSSSSAQNGFIYAPFVPPSAPLNTGDLSTEMDVISVDNFPTFSDAENESSSSLFVNPWPIVQDRAVGFCRAEVSTIGPP